MTTDSTAAELRDAVRDVLDDRLALDRLRRFLDTGERIDAALWKNAAELGWLGLSLPERHGGSALGAAEMAVVHEELGRSLAPLPYLPTVLCGEAIAHSGSASQQARWLPEIAQGACIGSLTSPADALSGQLPEIKRQASSLRLSGVSQGLLSPDGARLVIVFARDESGSIAALLVEPGNDGAGLKLQKTADLTRHIGWLQFDGMELPKDRLLAGDGSALAQRLLAYGGLALACDSIGGAARVFELTVEYLKTRHQFGRAIGSFQALKHRAADLRVLQEATGAMVADAVSRAGTSDEDAYASMAKFYACDAYAHTAADAIQLHGGIGFTWEHYCHLFLKRAKLNQQLFGPSEWHRDRAARLLTAKEAA